MVYRRNPVDKSRPRSQASGPLSENFTDYKRTFAVNHGDINDATDAGKHIETDMLRVEEVPVPGTNFITLINSNSEEDVNERNVLPGSFLTMIQYISSSISQTIPMTEGLKTVNDPTSALVIAGQLENGWFREESGTLIKWGSIPLRSNFFQSNFYSVKFPRARNIPVFAAIPTIFLIGSPSSNNVSFPISLYNTAPDAPSTTGFSLYTANAGLTFNIYFLAIGT